MDPWGSHLPVLVAFAARSYGHFLELGCGDYSTPILHAIYQQKPPIMLKAHTRPTLLSLENDLTFMGKFLDLQQDWHAILSVKSWSTDDPRLHEMLTKTWEVAFVDQHPGEHRGPAISLLRETTNFIIAHDTQNPAAYGYEPLLSSFKYRMDYKRFPPPCPWTTVVSDFFDPRKIFDGC
jgi:hypothetical protein